LTLGYGIRNATISVNKGEISEVNNGTLKYGSVGTEVKELQTMLVALGFDVGGIDGDFGKKTYYALREYQRSKNLVIDGIYGTKT
jgi:N-acetylmuramoyl-L-alanine amidase